MITDIKLTNIQAFAAEFSRPRSHGKTGYGIDLVPPVEVRALGRVELIIEYVSANGVEGPLKMRYVIDEAQLVVTGRNVTLERLA